MKYYLDTNIIIYLLKGLYPNILSRFNETPSFLISIPDIVIGEIEYGARKSIKYEKTITLYNSFIDRFEIAHFDRKAMKEYGFIRSQLEKKGQLIGPNDLIIASIVKANMGVLVTHNVKEFSKVDGLLIEDWCV